MKPHLNKNFKFPASEEEMIFGSGAMTGNLVSVNSGWRVFKPVIAPAKCIRCLLCWVYCPDGVIGKEEKYLTIDYDFCKGCGICAQECPRQAISMGKE